MNMDRRKFIQTAIGVATMVAMNRSSEADTPQHLGRIMTVEGPITPSTLGVTLPHEHVMVDFIGADKAGPARYDAQEVFDIVLPHLKRLCQAGAQALVECTPAYVGRDPVLLKRLAVASGLRLLTNTGYYAASGGKFLPPQVQTESADQLAARWIAEARDGIGSTGIRPGFIKIGVDGGPLNAAGRKLIEAAARTHRATGLVIASHTGDGRAAHEQLEILAREGVDARAWIWVHAQAESDSALHLKAARQGGWIEYDGIGPQTIDQHVSLVKLMKEQGLLSRVLISQDAGWYNVGEPRGGTFRPFDLLFTKFIPALRKAGFTQREIDRLTRENPADTFAIKVQAKTGSLR